MSDSAKPKTIFCDIDGTLLKHSGNIQRNLIDYPVVLPGVLEQLKAWDRASYTLVLTTGRAESARKTTQKQLQLFGIQYDHLLMGLPNGDRVVINDKKPDGKRNTAYGVNLVRNEGMEHLDLGGEWVTVSDSVANACKHVDKPWGYEELVDCNDRYVVKKLFMKAGHACSTQYHKLKRETIVVFSGKLKISTGPTLDALTSRVFEAGESITIEPYTVHQMEAVEDAVYYETSTNELWDVVRLTDRYGRASAAPAPAPVPTASSYATDTSIDSLSYFI